MKKKEVPIYASLKDFLTLDFQGLKGIFEEISNGISVTNEAAEFIYANKAFSRITGYEQAEIIGENPGILHSGRHGKAYYQAMWDDILKKGRWEGEIWNRRKSGEIYPEFLTITRVKNNKNEIFYLAVFSDISVVERENKEQINLALRDPLTKLCNRTLLLEKFEDHLHHYQRDLSESNNTTGKIAVLFMDLNKFKTINDTLGHLAGDEILVFVAGCLNKGARSIDTMARVGGDEFVAVLPKIKNREDVIEFASHLADGLKKGISIQGKKITPTLSVGVSLYPDDSRDLEGLLQQADKAMYVAKQNNQYICFFEDL